MRVYFTLISVLLIVVCNNVQPYKYNGKELDWKNGLVRLWGKVL